MHPPPRGGPLLPFTTLSTEPVADCRVFRVQRVRRRSGRTGLAHDYYRIDAPTWVTVIALTPDDRVVLVRQERHGIGAQTLETPAGMVNEGEDPAVAALRELREETGYSAPDVAPLGWVHPNPAIQGNRCFAFLARNAVVSGEPTPDEHEEIEVVTVPRESLPDRVRRGEITHAIDLAAFYLLDAHGGALAR